MNPTRIIAQNYRSFSALYLDLPEGCVAVVGDNGAGKSSLVDVIDVALFGPQSRSLSDYLSDDAPGDLTLLLEFEHAGQPYRVRRGYSAKGRGKATLDFEFLGNVAEGGPWDGWMPLTKESIKETQAAIEQKIGLSRETFRASAFLAQGDGAAFTEAQPRERKRVLAEVLGLDVWERLHELAKGDKSEAETDRTAVVYHLAQADEVVATKEQRIEDLGQAQLEVVTWTNRLAESERLYETLREQLERDKVDREGAARFQAVRDHCKAEVDRLEEQGRKALAEREHIDAELKALAGAPSREDIGHLLRAQEVLRKRDRDAEERERIKERVEALREERHTFKAHICPTCHQLVENEARRKVQESLDAREADLSKALLDVHPDDDALNEIVMVVSDEITEVIRDPGMVETMLEEARRAEARREAIAERQKVAPQPVDRVELAQAREQLELSEADYAKLSAGVRSDEDIAKLSAQLDERKRATEGVRASLELAKQAEWRAQSAIEGVQAAEKVAEELRTKLEDVDARLTVLALLERAFGPNGIPAMIVENAAIPQIEAEASRILSELGTGLRVELRTQRELKSGDGLAETLDVIVVSEGGAVRAYETFSGGERTRINLALRIALARLLAHRRGAESRVLVVDEPEFLDEPGTEALASVLRGMSSDFDRIYLVSHVSTLRDAFEQSILVTKTDGRSEVATPHTRARTSREQVPV